MSVSDRRLIRVLLVDDDPDARALAKRLLARAGITDVVEAVDGTDGIAQARDALPELVLLDISMPGRSGLEVLPELRAASPASTVVMLSSLSRARVERTALELGAVGFVDKRTPPSEFVTEVLLAAAFVDTVVAEASAELDGSPSDPRHARRLVRELLGASGGELLLKAELLTTELVTNAVLHASDAPLVRIFVDPRTVRVEVQDRTDTAPRPREPEVERPGGRGLQIVDTVAARWGVDLHEDGKVVWFELDRRDELAEPPR